jgi:hypothetical protein
LQLRSESWEVTSDKSGINRRRERPGMNEDCRGEPIIAFVGATVDLNDHVIIRVSAEFE